MKTLRLLVAVGLIAGFHSVGLAQSKSDSGPGTGSSKPVVKQQVGPKQDPNVSSQEKFATEAQKEAWKKSNAPKAEEKAAVQNRSISASTPVVVVKKERPNNTLKALPPDYIPAENGTKQEEK